MDKEGYLPIPMERTKLCAHSIKSKVADETCKTLVVRNGIEAMDTSGWQRIDPRFVLIDRPTSAWMLNIRSFV